MQVKVRALIWHGDRVIVARESRQGRPHLTLPGGRPHAHEALVDALAREVREATGVTGPPAARWLGNLYRPQSVTA